MGILSNNSLARAQQFGFRDGFTSTCEPISSTSKTVSRAKTYRTHKIYKIAISLIFGVLCFGMNLNPVHFSFPPFEANLLPGLVLPMVVTLAWGWPYGLLSVVLGLGCQFMWFTEWSRSDMELFVTVPMLAIWVVWHGWCSAVHPEGRFPARNPYKAEIVFRLCNTVVLYTVLFSLLKWHPPEWAISGRHGVQLFSMIHFRAIEQAVNGFIVLLISDVLFNLGTVRWLLGLKKRSGQIPTGYVIGTALLFGLLFWIIDGLVDYYKFREHLRFLIFRAPENIFDSILLKVSSPDLFARTTFVVTCLTGGVLVYRLLHKQREGEAALRESESRYRRLHETMWDGFVQMDMAGRIVDCNIVFEQLLGHTKKELLYKCEADLSPAKWHAENAKIFSEQILAKGRSSVYEKEYIHADGSKFTAELRTFLITDDTHNPIGIWSIVRDVTERKKAEKERERAIVALKQSNEDLKQFAYVASHDLQEPLRMVASYTQLIAERYSQQLDAKGHKFINYAVDGASRMQALIRDLLAFSRVETHSEGFKMVDTHSTLGAAIANLKTMIDETGALITNENLPRVQADQGQLTMVFQNLINNAIKFRNKSSTPHIHISAHRRKDHWCFNIKDNGIGIDPIYKNKIFVVFQRLHTQKEYPGTGIGLALCKRIIDRHHGQIWFESRSRQGTTFYFTLPS